MTSNTSGNRFQWGPIIADNSDPQPWEFDERDPEPWEFYDDDGSPLLWTYDDGGRAAIAPYTDDDIGDCVTRAIAIATGRAYAEVYDMVDKFGRAAGYLGIACLGVPHELTDELISEITGWRWVPLHNAHLVMGDLPDESRLIAVMRNHVCAVIDGVIRDVRDCGREDDDRVYVLGVYLPPGETDSLESVCRGLGGGGATLCPRASALPSARTSAAPASHGGPTATNPRHKAEGSKSHLLRMTNAKRIATR